MLRNVTIVSCLALAACGGTSAVVGSGDSGAPATGPAGGLDGSLDSTAPATGTGEGGATTDSGNTGDAARLDSGADATTTGGDAGGTAAGRKRGVAYGFKADADVAALSAPAGGMAWWYNWSPRPDSTLTQGGLAGAEFVPMIWGGSFDTTTLATQVPAGAKYLLTFNEPNFGSQANLTPAQAAALWPQIEAFASSKNLKIVSPALNYCGGSCNETNPFTWLDMFFAACTGCKVDYIGAHWYACTLSALQSYLAQYESKYGKPIWLTEFSCLDKTGPTEQDEETYMKQAVAALEADPMVFRYAWFTGRSSTQPVVNLLAGDAGAGALTPLGTTYVSLP